MNLLFPMLILVSSVGIWLLIKKNAEDRMFNVWVGMILISIIGFVVFPLASDRNSFSSKAIPNETTKPRNLKKIGKKKENQINSIFSKKLKDYSERLYGVSEDSEGNISFNEINSAYQWVMGIDKVEYIDKTLYVEVNGNFITLFDEEKTNVAKSLQKFASKVISSELDENPIDVKENVDIIFEFNEQAVGQTYSENTNDFEWEDVQQ